MPTKKSADKPVSSSPAGAPQNTAPASAKSRARGSSAKPVTHKHKQNAATLSESAAAAVPAAQPVTAVVPAPTHDDISIRAYLIAEARSFQGGSPEDDWFRAERELIAGRR